MNISKQLPLFPRFSAVFRASSEETFKTFEAHCAAQNIPTLRMCSDDDEVVVLTGSEQKIVAGLVQQIKKLSTQLLIFGTARKQLPKLAKQLKKTIRTFSADEYQHQVTLTSSASRYAPKRVEVISDKFMEPGLYETKHRNLIYGDVAEKSYTVQSIAPTDIATEETHDEVNVIFKGEQHLFLDKTGQPQLAVYYPGNDS